MDRRALLQHLIVPVVAASGGVAHAQDRGATRVLVLASERGGAYDAAAEACVQALRRENASFQVLVLYASEFGSQTPLDYDFVVTLGVSAAQAVIGRQTAARVLCTLLPQASFERLLSESKRRTSPSLSALYLNQPVERQLDLVRLAIPDVRAVGVLWGQESLSHKPALTDAARKRGLRLVQAEVGVGDPVFRELKPVIDDAEVLLALADAHIYNSRTIQNILLTSFRARVPMLAFSPAYVRAGALLALYSTPAQIGRQAAALVVEALQSGGLPQPSYPRQFSVGVNEHVARSLGLQLDAQVLLRQLIRREGGS